MKYIVMLLVLMPGILACVVPSDGMQIRGNTQLCTDVYYLNKGISLSGKNFVLDCQGAVLKSWKSGKGISIENAQNVTVTGCRILHYYTGIYVGNSNNIYLLNNHLVQNKEGTRFLNVTGSAIYNNDVSLEKPVTIMKSENNVLTLTNRLVSGSFCEKNYCNVRKQVVDLAMQQKDDANAMRNWLSEQISGKKTKQRLYSWAFGSLFN